MGQLCEQKEGFVDLFVDRDNIIALSDRKQNVKVPELLPNVKEIEIKLDKFLFSKSNNKSRGVIQKPCKLDNNIIYWGQWKNGVVHGWGEFYLSDGSYLQGVSTNGEIDGLCRLIHPNGDYYQGQIINNSANGEGVYVQRQRNIKFIGNFIKNLPHGFCTQIRQDGKFEGDFKNGKKIRGKLVQKIGNQTIIYEGQFQNNLFHGYAKLKNSIGIYQGDFNEGLKSGEGKFTWNNGYFFVGKYTQDMKNGMGTMYDSNGRLYMSGKWVNDQCLWVK